MNFVPSQPYLTTFLKEHHNLDEATLNSSIWPVSTYSMLFFSLPCGILASFFPSFTLFLGVSSRILLYVLLLCLTSVLSVQVVEILFGLFIVVDGLALVSASCLGAPESSYAYISSGIMVSRELALVLSSLVGQLFYEVIYDSDDGSLEYLFVASLVSCCLAFLWFALRIRITAPSKGSKAPADYKSTISSLSSLYASKPSLYLLTFILCISYASFLTAADYNFMLLTSFNSSNLGVIATSLSLFGAIGAFLAGLYYERYKRGLLEIALIGMASTSAFAYLGLAGDTYWVVVVCVVVPWAVFQTSYTLTTILVTTTLGESLVSLLPTVLGVGRLLSLTVASVVQGSVSASGGRTEDYFVSCMILESTVVGVLLFFDFFGELCCFGVDFAKGFEKGDDDSVGSGGSLLGEEDGENMRTKV